MLNKIFKNKFRRMSENDELSGVVSGFAYAVGFPTWVLRIALVLALIFTNYHIEIIVAYVIIGVFAPEWESDPEDYKKVTSS